MNEPPPLPPPSGSICPNCGAAQNAKAPFCTNCGAPLQSAPQSFARKALKWILTLALSLAAVAIGALGACAGIIAMIGNADPSGAYGSGASGTQLFFWAVAVIAAIALCGWLIRLINQKL